MAAIAFDIGDSFCKIGVAKSKTLGVMQNQVGKRKTSTVVAFTRENRLFDSEAISQQMSNSKNTVVGFKALMGKSLMDKKDIEAQLPYLNQPVVKSDTPEVGLEVSYLQKKTVFTPTQVTASLLTFLKDQAEKGLGSKLPECVIGCPPWWTEVERHALLDAAKLAGVNVARIMNETTAIALDYGINLQLKEDSQETCMFIDVGHSNTNVAVVNFWRKKGRDCGMKVICTASARGVGGRSFSTILEKYFASYILKKYNLDVMSQAKPRLKLKTNCEKVKTRLTANNVVPFNVEYMMDGKDVSGSINRKDFEEAAVPVLEAILQPIKQAMAASGKSAADFKTIELVGGTTRIPCVKRALSKFLGQELSYHCDADESCAKGLVLQAAMLSASFRTRSYQVEDISPHPIEVSWGPVNKSPNAGDRAVVFVKNNPVPSVKAITYPDRVKDFQLTVKYADPSVPTPLIGQYIIKGFPKKIEGEKVKVKVFLKMSINGTVEVKSAQCIELFPEEAAPAPADTPKKMEEEPKEESKKEDNGDKADKPSEKKEQSKPKPAEKKKQRKKRTDLFVESKNLSLPVKVARKLAELEQQMNNTDRIVAETAALRNDLEAYILEIRGKIREELKSYVAKDISDSFLEQLQYQEDWLYDEGYDAPMDTLRGKFQELKKVGDPIFLRKQEYERGKELVEQLKVRCGQYRQLASSGDKKYAHIEKKELDSILLKCKETDTWATNAAVLIGNTPHHQDPPVKCAEIIAKENDLSTFSHQILSKPVPKKEEKKEEAKKEEEAKKDEAKADMETEDTGAANVDAAKEDDKMNVEEKA